MPSKQCSICCNEVTKLSKSPETCSEKHPQERACNECWEEHLSCQVEELGPKNVKCIFCEIGVDRDGPARLAHKGTLVRYDCKVQERNPQDPNLRRCQDRCAASLNHALQHHDREKAGRIFACDFCGFQTCIDCDRPEHAGETCQEYQTRVVLGPYDQEDKDQSLQSTQKDDEEKKVPRTHKQDEDDSLQELETYEKCPDCMGFIVIEKGCGYTPCTYCAHRFCSRCGIPWVGKNSEYEFGQAAHLEGCLYRKRDAGSTHGLKRKFPPDAEVAEKIAQRKEDKRQKRELKKKAVASSSW